MPLIIGLTGLIGCGKGTVSTYLQEKYGAEMFRFSSYLEAAINAVHLEPSRDHFIKMSEVLREGFGDDVLSRALAHDVLQTNPPLAVIDGLRRTPELPALEALPGFMLVRVDADARVRYERIAGRGEKSDETTLTWEQFLENEKRSTELTIPEVMREATRTLTNNGTLEDLQKQVDEMMTSLHKLPTD